MSGSGDARFRADGVISGTSSVSGSSISTATTVGISEGQGDALGIGESAAESVGTSTGTCSGFGVTNAFDADDSDIIQVSTVNLTIFRVVKDSVIQVSLIEESVFLESEETHMHISKASVDTIYVDEPSLFN
jgi:hypothetical protein